MTHARPFDIDITPETAGWQCIGLRVVQLSVGGRLRFATGDDEVLVLPLTGGCDVACDDERMTLTGRRSVFSRITDFLYLPRGTTAILRAPNGGRFALPSARSRQDLPFRYGAAEDVPVEPRGAGRVHHFCTPDSFETDRLTACEVLSGNDGGKTGNGPEEIRYYEGAEGGGCGYTVLMRNGRPGPGTVVPHQDLYHLKISVREERTTSPE